RGAVYLEDEDLCALSEDEMCQRRGRDIGMVFQGPMTALNPVMTIGAQVMETILIHTETSTADAQAEAARVLTRVGL
ncbi:microcin ABC transporter ATP-binding protein, partial [Rhizobium sp. SIMBA_035]